MAKKSVKAETQTPQNTDLLHVNDILKQKIDVPAGHQLTYLPITGAVASSSMANQGPLFVLDSSPDTYWQPSDQTAGAHIELVTPNPYICYGVDIKFKESEGKKFNLKIDVLDKEHNRWLTMVTAESSLIDDNKYERFHAAQQFKTDTYRVIINSIFDTVTGHLYTQPKITQVRLFGLVPDADVAKYKVIKDQECPEGYGKDAESGQCVKSIPSQIIKPKTIDAHSAVDMGAEEPAGNDADNLLTVDPNDKLTLKGVGSTIEYGLARTDAISGVYIHKLNNPPRQYTLLVAFYNGEDKQPFYSFIVDIPDSQDKYVHILNEPLRADRFVLSLVDNSEPNQWFSLFGLYLIGEQNVPEPDNNKEPPIPKSCSIKTGGWGSVSDKKPEEWTVKEMGDADKKGKWKGIGKDGKNVFHLCDSKEDAEAFIKRKIWESKNKPTEPPPTGGGGGGGDTGTTEVDSFGVKKIYPDADSKRFLTNADIEAKIRHYASGAPDDNSIECNIDTKDKKFRDMEATIVIVNKGMEHHDRFSYKLRGGSHKDGQGWWYIFETSTDGKWTNESFQIEKPHPKYFKYGNKITPLFNINTDLQKSTIGIKAITINKTINGKEAVHLEQWINLDPLGADGKPKNEGWKKYMEVDDVGQFENGLMLECQGTNVTMRIDGILSIKDKAKMPDFYFASVREIKLGDITTTPPTEPPVEPPVTEPPVEPPTTGGGEGATVSGITFPVAKEELTGKTRVDDYYYNANNGLRIDFQDNPKDGSFVNNACAVYGTFVGDVTAKEDRGIKWSWNNHSGSNIVNTYMVNIRNGDGQTRSRIEVKHPSDYRTLVDYGKQKTGTPAKKGQLWGIMGIRRTQSDGSVLLQLYEDQGITAADNKPGNKWVKLLEFVDKEYKITDYSKQGMEVTGRFDDNKGDKNIKIEKAVLVELTSVSATPKAAATKPAQSNNQQQKKKK